MISLLAAVGTPPPAATGWFELRRAGVAASELISVRGWADSRCGPPEVTLLIDGREIARADAWSSWQVPSSFPAAPGADRPGFATQIDPLHFTPGVHLVKMVASAPACDASASLGEAAFVSSALPVGWIAWTTLLYVAVAIVLAGLALHRFAPRYHLVPIRFVVPSVLALSIGSILLGPRLSGNATAPSAFFSPLASWDGAWYLRIAREGYAAIGNPAYAFFPLYPVLLRLLTYLPVPIELAASVVNAGLFVLSMRALRKLTAGMESGWPVYACLPFSFFFVAVYTESLALFFSLTFLLMLRQQRPGLAFASGFLAGLTRVTSLGLVLLAIDELRAGRRRSVIASLGPVAGAATYMTFLWLNTGDPLKFVHAQEHFGRATSFSAGRLVQVIGRALTSNDRWEWLALGTLAFVLTGAVMLVRAGRIGEAAYSAALVCMPLASVALTSMHRYALLAFPVVPFMAGLIPNRVTLYAIVALEVVLLVVFSSHFGQQHWVG